MSKNFSRRSAAAREVSPAVERASMLLSIAGNQAGNQQSHPTNTMHRRIINTGEGSPLLTLSNALDKLSIPPLKKPVKPTGAEGRVASQPFKLNPCSTLPLSSDSDSDSGPESTAGREPTGAEEYHTEGPETVSSGNDVSSLGLSQTHRQQSDESSHDAPSVIDVRKSSDALLGDNASVADPQSPLGSTPQLHLLHSMKTEQLEAILGSDSDSEVGSKGKNVVVNKGFQELENMSGNTAMFGVGNIQQSFNSEAGLAGPSDPPASLTCPPKPSWVEVVDAVIDDAHRPNTFFRPPPVIGRGAVHLWNFAISQSLELLH
ncbi:hypothetical protein BDZ97DRAFT_1923552 [Flammula alnicola]|nr:hypothetical protein BDZ97DRAFT_1923552 [Flammula alnicola]